VDRRVGALGGLDDDVAAGVAGTDHHDPLARELVGALVVGGVDQLALERVLTGVVGQLRVPVVAVGDDEVAVVADLDLVAAVGARRRRSSTSQPPSVAGSQRSTSVSNSIRSSSPKCSA
jgi:hypothetical protein